MPPAIPYQEWIRSGQAQRRGLLKARGPLHPYAVSLLTVLRKHWGGTGAQSATLPPILLLQSIRHAPTLGPGDGHSLGPLDRWLFPSLSPCSNVTFPDHANLKLYRLRFLILHRLARLNF